MRAGTLLRWQAMKKVLKRQIKDAGCLVDIGGFDGYISANIAKGYKNLKIIVIDLDIQGLKKAKNNGLKTFCASALNLPIKDTSVEAVLCFDILEHVEEDERIFQEVFRILKPGGKFFITTPFENGVTFPFSSKEQTIKINKSFGHVRMGYSLAQLKSLCAKFDLKVIYQNSFFNMFSRFAYWLLPKPGALPLFKLFIYFEPYIKLNAQEHIIIAEKGA